MPQKRSKNTDPWAAIAETYRKSLERRPEGKGWLIADEAAKRFGCSKQHFYRISRGMKLEQFSGTEYRNGKLQPQTWYRPNRTA